MSTILRYLRAILGAPSPSIVASVRRAAPIPRTWIARRERALALRHLGDSLSRAELADIEIEQTLRYIDAISPTVRAAKPARKAAAS
jgi:hypothetical protein